LSVAGALLPEGPQRQHGDDGDRDGEYRQLRDVHGLTRGFAR
jgi:hypothetical protein